MSMVNSWKDRHDWIVSECHRTGNPRCHVARSCDQWGWHDRLTIKCASGGCQVSIRIGTECNNTAASSLVCEASYQLGRKCTCDNGHRLVDGLTVRECLAAYERLQREDHTTHARYVPVSLGGVHLTPNQRDAARLAWSAELKRKQQEAKDRERAEVVVDDDRWEP